MRAKSDQPEHGAGCYPPWRYWLCPKFHSWQDNRPLAEYLKDDPPAEIRLQVFMGVLFCLGRNRMNCSIHRIHNPNTYQMASSSFTSFLQDPVRCGLISRSSLFEFDASRRFPCITAHIKSSRRFRARIGRRDS